MSEVAQRAPTPAGVLVPVSGLARTHSGPGPRPAEGAGAPHGLQLRHLPVSRGAGRRGHLPPRRRSALHRPADAEPADPPTGGDRRHAAAAAPPRRAAADRGRPRAAGRVPHCAGPGRPGGQPHPAGSKTGTAAAAGGPAVAPGGAPGGRRRGQAAEGRGGRAGGRGLAGDAAGRGVLAARHPPGRRRPGLADHQPGDVARGAGGDGHRGIRARGMDPGPRTRWPTTAPSAWPNWSACRSSTGRAAPSP